MLDVLKDMVYLLPENIQRFALELHKRYIDKEMTCAVINDTATHFAYAYTKNSRRPLSPRDIYSRRIWEFEVSMKYGYCIVVRSKNTDKYAELIKTFPLFLYDKRLQRAMAVTESCVMNPVKAAARGSAYL